MAVPSLYREPERAARIALIADSHARLLGRPLSGPADDVVAALWDSPLAILAHGTEQDPVFFFGNKAALAAFETDVEAFTRMPSRLSAEAPLREERQALLDRVTANGFIDDYAGVRISARGRRFRIGPAVVWNLIDESGRRHGQAACFTP
ncbi:MEKHLA domain-containing protein [Novosphingobium mangrovi (ex Huang et al. 2023)]|uniref:MEKHLA domain-containing protein n=1 Tax=Novosphingobium mangrovi (ex Huang et al. 2023) TaxID=2976432 RepID=A0ABT2I8B2_9SPHN|nr:MEKHLA domain-containing protein [Novosphingobium mangrovi (ex Huang et al. 2023)]MCT2401070.1 MEKHLA domain-containing protein [Novosphingobium mangrovi (ex Huang et al. 2023)]